MKQKPTVEIIKQNCMRYEYDATEIKELCDAFGFNAFDYRAIRNEVYDSISPIAQAVNGKVKLEDKERVDAAWKHIQDLHFRSSCYGNIIFGCPRLTRIRKNSMWQYAIPKSKITRAMVARLLLVPNLYIMVNTSRTFSRKSDEVVSVNALYLDIDNVQDVEGFVQKCKEEGRFAVEPSKIISSGGGLHIYFHLENAYAKEKLVPYINRIQKALHTIYPEADKLSDLVRFLRLDGSTYNKPIKGIKTVHTVYESDKVYTVSEIGPKLVAPYVPRPKKEKSKVHSFNRKDKPFAVVPQGTWRELELKRVRDMEYLYKIGHFDDDRRKRGIFFYALFVLRASGSFGEASAMAWEMNKAFKYPLKPEEVENQLSSVKKNGFNYRYKRETLVGQLEIDKLTRGQQEGLRAMMPYAIKLERQKVHKKKTRRNEKGLTSRKAQAQKNYNKVRSLLEQGFKQKDIVNKTGLSKSRVSEIVKQIKVENQVGQH